MKQTLEEKVDAIWFNSEDGVRKRQQIVDLIKSSQKEVLLKAKEEESRLILSWAGYSPDGDIRKAVSYSLLLPMEIDKLITELTSKDENKE